VDCGCTLLAPDRSIVPRESDAFAAERASKAGMLARVAGFLTALSDRLHGTCLELHGYAIASPAGRADVAGTRPQPHESDRY
jgi:hypothetical protein